MKSATKVLFFFKTENCYAIIIPCRIFFISINVSFYFYTIQYNTIQYNTIQYNKEDNLYKTIYNKSILHVHHNIISYFVLKYNGPHSLRKWLIVTKRLPCMREVRV